jgi:uncharacterized coiled-coil protein SlyX
LNWLTTTTTEPMSKKWNIRSVFFEDEKPKKGKPGKSPAASKTPPAAASAPRTSPAPAAAAQSSAPAPSGPVTGGISDRFVKVLMAAMEGANLPGFDYLEYKKTLQNLKKMNFTDSVRYQTAYTAAQSMGVTPAQLADSAQHYLNVLGKEKAKFSQALKGQRSQQVSDKEQQLKQLEGSIAQQEAKIKELQEQIKKTKTNQNKLQSDISKSNSKLAQTQADFEATYEVLTQGIEKDVVQMKEFLK